jgi:hypothetical protein
MVHRRLRKVTLTAITMASAIAFTAMDATGGSAATTAAANPGYVTAVRQQDSSARLVQVARANVRSGAAAAHGDPYYLCYASNHNECVAPVIHTDVFDITGAFPYASLSFMDEYTTPNGNAWWLITEGDDLCLNWAGPDDNGVYADTCQPGDPNELWYNHNPGQLINLGGNEDEGEESYLTLCPNSMLLCVVQPGFATIIVWYERSST